MSRLFRGKVIFYLFFLWLLEGVLPALIGSVFFRPRLLYLMILYAAFERQADAVPLAFVVGLLLDLTGPQAFGLEMTLLVAAALILKFFIRKIDRGSFPTRLVVTFSFVSLVMISVILLSAFFGNLSQVTVPMISNCLGAALSTAVVMPLFFAMAGKIFHDRAYGKQYELFR